MENGEDRRRTVAWRDTMVVVAISVLLAAAITVASRVIVENLTF
jgi:hypothetical protein